MGQYAPLQATIHQFHTHRLRHKEILSDRAQIQMQEISVENRVADVAMNSREHVDLAVAKTVFALPPLSCTI